MSSSIEALVNREYAYGFVSDIESDTIPKGLSEDTVRLISERKNEPEWLLEWRLKAFRRDHHRRFRLGARDLLVFLLVTAVPLAAFCWYVWSKVNGG